MDRPHHAPAGHTRIAAAGLEWDAVKIPRFVGLQVLHALPKPGAVMVEPTDRALYFLVPPGSTANWTCPQSSPLGESTFVILPPHSKQSPPGPYWLITPNSARLHTDTRVLGAALMNAVSGQRPDQSSPT